MVSEVPQRTVIVLVLFLILISDISHDLSSVIFCFTNDISLIDSKKLQSDIDLVLYCLVKTTCYWFQVSTCVFFVTKGPASNVYMHTSHTKSNCKSNCMSSKDLGILVVFHLKKSVHFKKLVRHCKQFSNWTVKFFIFLFFISIERDTMLSLYRSMVSSRLDYGCQLW